MLTGRYEGVIVTLWRYQSHVYEETWLAPGVAHWFFCKLVEIDVAKDGEAHIRIEIESSANTLVGFDWQVVIAGPDCESIEPILIQCRLNDSWHAFRSVILSSQWNVDTQSTVIDLKVLCEQEPSPRCRCCHDKTASQ